jgi:hypothetical protein
MLLKQALTSFSSFIMMIRRLSHPQGSLPFLLLACCTIILTQGFCPHSQQQQQQQQQQRAARPASPLRMGLYDTPLPPRPPPRDDGRKEPNKDDEHDDFVLKEQQKQRNADQKQRDLDFFLKGGTPDANWLPNMNPRPIDDEPWFTG